MEARCALARPAWFCGGGGRSGRVLHELNSASPYGSPRKQCAFSPLRSFRAHLSGRYSPYHFSADQFAEASSGQAGGLFGGSLVRIRHAQVGNCLRINPEETRRDSLERKASGRRYVRDVSVRPIEPCWTPILVASESGGSNCRPPSERSMVGRYRARDQQGLARLRVVPRSKRKRPPHQAASILREIRPLLRDALDRVGAEFRKLVAERQQLFKGR
jgi:hypothetical protein